jgi:hypothetical protein
VGVETADSCWRVACTAPQSHDRLTHLAPGVRAQAAARLAEAGQTPGRQAGHHPPVQEVAGHALQQRSVSNAAGY